MRANDRAEFFELLNLCYSTALRPLPGPDSIKLWESLLAPYSIEQVSAGFYRHMQVSKFVPMPADIIAFLTPDPTNDGRPDENEAWVTALAGNDEFKSVRWTAETAQALTPEVKKVLLTDEIAARMAFKAIYARLCREARAAGRPVEWFVSWSFDRHEREDFARHAVQTGVLQLEQAKQHVPALAAPTDSYDTDKARRQIASIKSQLSAALSGREKIAQQRAREIEAEAERIAQLKLDTAIRVAEYEGSQA